MFYPEADPVEWAKRYGIKLDKLPCPQCKADLTLSKPIAMTGYRGLEAEICSGCGYESQIFRVVPVGDKLEFWKQLLNGD